MYDLYEYRYIFMAVYRIKLMCVRQLAFYLEPGVPYTNQQVVIILLKLKI